MAGILLTTSLTSLSLTKCSLAAKNPYSDLNWGFYKWQRKRTLARHIQAHARGFRGLRALQELQLDLDIELVPEHMREEGQGESEEDSEGDEEEAEGGELTAADVQPLVDAIASLRPGLRQLRVSLPRMSQAQRVQLQVPLTGAWA
jgi:hypothetical protein